MSIIDTIIERQGVLVTLKALTESVDEQGYSTKSYISPQVKCIFNELTGLEDVWDVAGLLQPGDAQVYFPSIIVPKIGDRIVDENYKEWEIIQMWTRKYLNTIHCHECIGRKK